jgi:hypothetical protein
MPNLSFTAYAEPAHCARFPQNRIWVAAPIYAKIWRDCEAGAMYNSLGASFMRVPLNAWEKVLASLIRRRLESRGSLFLRHVENIRDHRFTCPVSSKIQGRSANQPIDHQLLHSSSKITIYDLYLEVPKFTCNPGYCKITIWGKSQQVLLEI